MVAFHFMIRRLKRNYRLFHRDSCSQICFSSFSIGWLRTRRNARDTSMDWCKIKLRTFRKRLECLCCRCAVLSKQTFVLLKYRYSSERRCLFRKSFRLTDAANLKVKIEVTKTLHSLGVSLAEKYRRKTTKTLNVLLYFVLVSSQPISFTQR